MSSLAAVQADGFYYPADFDPQKHGSLNNYHGSHPLRERAAKIGEGILVIRFEVPFHIWCSKCGEKIAKGERFNADKKAIGMYHTTKIWQFSMRHHCGCIITIQSDPKHAEYLVVEGAKKKVEDYSSKDAEVMELIDDTERERLALDPLYRLEQGEASRKRARTAAEEVADLLEDADAKHRDAYATNAQLRAQLRVVRKEEQALDSHRKALHLPAEVKLLPFTEDDNTAAALAFYAHDAAGGSAKEQQASKRQAILTQPIFPPPQRALRPAPLTGPRPPPASAGPLHPQSVTSRERQDSKRGDGDGVAAAHKHLPGMGSRPQGRLAAAQHLLTLPASGKSSNYLAVASAGDVDVGPGMAVALRAPTGQPGAARGVVEGTQAASRERGRGLQAAHTAAHATVAAWQAARGGPAGRGAAAGKPAAAQTAVAPAQGGGSQRGSKLPSASTLLKAQTAAQRRGQGVGLKLPERIPE